jgi:hypothetical protein
VNHLDDLIASARQFALGEGKPLTADEEEHMRRMILNWPSGCQCDICVARKREPFLSPCFDLGAQWTSRDLGATWQRCPSTDQYGGMATHHLTVIAIDADRSEVTFRVTKQDAGRS